MCVLNRGAVSKSSLGLAFAGGVGDAGGVFGEAHVKNVFLVSVCADAGV